MRVTEVSATLITDREWMRERLDVAARLYGRAPSRVLGTVWWYSASSVLVAPPIESLVRTGVGVDPALEAVLLRITRDGRFVDSRSTRAFSGDATALGEAYRAALEAAVSSVAAVTGATTRSLWAIAADSLASRLLWAGQGVVDVERATALAAPIADGIGSVMPRPRYTRVGPHTVVRRVSCCLIDKATGQEKCTSCPNQHPDVREQRIRAALG